MDDANCQALIEKVELQEVGAQAHLCHGFQIKVQRLDLVLHLLDFCLLKPVVLVRSWKDSDSPTLPHSK